MKSLFIKIFLSFWIIAILTSVSLAVSVMLQRQKFHPQDQEGLTDTVRYFGRAAVGIFEQRGKDSSSQYLELLSHDVRIHACLFDASGNLLTGKQCSPFQDLALRIAHGQIPEISIPHNIARLALPIAGSDGRTYIFVSELPVGPRAMLQRDVQAIAIRGGLAFSVSGVICYFLARFLTAPILRLRVVAQKITAGQLSVRAEQKLARRGDEMGDLVRDFNRMADTTEQVISRQRQLLYDVSHELRSPLTRINVAIDLLRDRVQEDPALNRIELDIQRLNELIGRLLTVTKLEGSSILVNPGPLSLSNLIESVATDADFEAREIGSRVNIVQASEVSIFGDYSLLRSALENVVRNAIRHTAPATSVEIGLECPANSDPSTSRITIRDYGTGVPEEELANIFEPFYRVIDSESKDSTGIGLGLSITERIIRLHKGQIFAANADGRGLLVTILLPVISR